MKRAEITERMESGRMTPSEAAEARMILAGHYAREAELLNEVLGFKPQTWMTFREKVSSDTRAERMWEMSDYGQRETRLRLSMKGLEKQLSALSTMIQVAQGEAKNQF